MSTVYDMSTLDTLMRSEDHVDKRGKMKLLSTRSFFSDTPEENKNSRRKEKLYLKGTKHNKYF